MLDGSPVVIDWDNCGPAPMAGELAMVLVEFGTTPARARDLHAAYVDAGGPARLTGRGDFTMPVAVLHHLVEIGRPAVAAPPPGTWPVAAPPVGSPSSPTTRCCSPTSTGC